MRNGTRHKAIRIDPYTEVVVTPEFEEYVRRHKWTNRLRYLAGWPFRVLRRVVRAFSR